jgi:hypothetical protein
MKAPRRRFLRLAAGAAALPAAARIARAQAYPTRPVRLIIGFNAGGAPDVVARLLCQWLSERVGQNFLVENRPGAGGNIAVEAVVRALADGYTLLQVGSPNFINASLYKDLKFNFLRDIAPVASIGRNPFVMEVNPSFPAKTVAEFIAYAKANPGQINMTSTGTGNLTHVIGELFKMMAGVDMLHVPGRGEMQAQSDLLAGRAQIMFDPDRFVAWLYQGRAVAGARRHRRDAAGDTAGCADRRRNRARFRRDRRYRHRRAAKHARRGDRLSQRQGQRCARRSRHQGAAGRSRLRADADVGGRIRHVHGR